ncbi:MAG TPA: ATP-binding protein [Actinomycetota bacterium]|nr:ATP-binding protein [Actinomycetota bacterium]
MESDLARTKRDKSYRGSGGQPRRSGTPVAFRGNAALYRDLVERLPGAVYVAAFGAEGRWSFVSPGIETLTGFAPHRFLEDPGFWWSRLHPDDRERVLQLEAQSRTSGGRFVADYRFLAADGNTVWVRDDAAVVPATDHPLLQGVMFDITSEKRAHTEVRAALAIEKEAADRLRELARLRSTFVSAVSHELRTPVSVVLGGARTLQQGIGTLPLDHQKQLVDSVVERATRLSEVLKDVLDFERLLAGIVPLSRERADVGELVVRTVERLKASAQGHPLLSTAQPTVAEVNSSMVERIIEILVTNALRHTPSGTPVWVRVEPKEGGALLTVEDRGPGVDRTMREAIFDPFRQGASPSAHDPGVGIGLTLAAQLAALHGGSAWVEDRDGGGAVFRVLLPSG